MFANTINTSSKKKKKKKIILETKSPTNKVRKRYNFFLISLK